MIYFQNSELNGEQHLFVVRQKGDRLVKSKSRSFYVSFVHIEKVSACSVELADTLAFFACHEVSARSKTKVSEFGGECSV